MLSVFYALVASTWTQESVETAQMIVRTVTHKLNAQYAEMDSHQSTVLALRGVSGLASLVRMDNQTLV